MALTDRIERLSGLLMAEKGFERSEPDPAALAGGDGDRAEPLRFVGTRRLWWGQAAIALVDASGLDPAGIERLVVGFFEFVYATRGSNGISYGTLCVVFQAAPPPAIIEYVRKLKRGADANKVWVVSWTVDLSSGHVVPHRLWPWGLYPGRSYIERALRRS